MSRLITASLIGSVEWFKNCPPSWKQQAYNDLSNTLNRKAWDPSVAIKKGIAFEDAVYRILSADPNAYEDEKYSDNFRTVLAACAGGQFQRKAKKFIDIEIGGETAEYCLYGKLDVFHTENGTLGPLIIDIKTSAKWGGRSKYLNTVQHLMYCLMEKVADFKYIVGIWDDADDEDNRTLEEVKAVDYTVPNNDFKELEAEVIERIKDTVYVLQSDEDLWKAYTTKFSRY
jgi:hypothetical protein